MSGRSKSIHVAVVSATPHLHCSPRPAPEWCPSLGRENQHVPKYPLKLGFDLGFCCNWSRIWDWGSWCTFHQNVANLSTCSLHSWANTPSTFTLSEHSVLLQPWAYRFMRTRIPRGLLIPSPAMGCCLLSVLGAEVTQLSGMMFLNTSMRWEWEIDAFHNILVLLFVFFWNEQRVASVASYIYKGQRGCDSGFHGKGVKEFGLPLGMRRWLEP